MMKGKGILTAVSAGQEVIQGIPTIYDSDVLAHPFYCSGTVHIAGEISDPLTIFKLTDLNHFLVNLRHDFFGGTLQPHYTRSLQREVDQTPAELLAGKLDFMVNREYANFGNWYHDWYINTFGEGSLGLSPLEICREYANWCNSWYLKTLGVWVPSPHDQFDPFILFCISVLSILFLFLILLLPPKEASSQSVSLARKCQ